MCWRSKGVCRACWWHTDPQQASCGQHVKAERCKPLLYTTQGASSRAPCDTTTTTAHNTPKHIRTSIHCGDTLPSSNPIPCCGRTVTLSYSHNKRCACTYTGPTLWRPSPTTCKCCSHRHTTTQVLLALCAVELPHSAALALLLAVPAHVLTPAAVQGVGPLS